MFVRDQLVVEDAAHDTRIVDDEGDAAIEADDGPQDAVSLRDAFVQVTNHGKFDVERLCELGLNLGSVRRNADDFAAQRNDFLICVAKPRRLDRSPRCECFGEEVQNDEFAHQTGEADVLARRRERSECRRWLSDLDHAQSVSAAVMSA